MNKRTIFLSIWVFAATLLHAQDVYVDLKNSTGSADYLLGSKLVSDASYISSALSVSSILSENTKMYADLSHSQIFPFNEYSSSQGEIGIQFRYLNIQDNQFFGGVFGYLNTYDELYSYYNNTGFGLYGKWKHYFKTSQLLTAGYDMSIKAFDEVETASNTEHEIYASYNQSFKTKTSVKLHAALAVQDFWPQTSFSGHGRYYVVTELEEIQTNSLGMSEIRLSQSLGSKVGLTLWMGTQSLMNDRTDSLALQDGLNNPFIDRFRWDGQSASLRLLYKMNGQNSFLLSHSYNKKSYINVPVYQFDFDLMDYTLINDEMVSLGYDREDERNSLNIKWTRDWMFQHVSWLSELEMVLGAGYTINKSNDALYDYESMNYNLSFNIYN